MTPPDSVRVPILVYHSIAPHHPGQTAEQRQLDVDTAAFRAQMSYLAQHDYKVVSLGTLVDALDGRALLPDHAVVITFDDGWETQYHNAFPILHQLGFTATFFIYTTPISHDEAFMTWDQLRELQSAGMSIESHSLTHPLLTEVDATTLRAEVETPRQTIEHNLGTTPDLFAYPYGAWNARTVAAVRAAGYQGARELPGGAWNKPADLFALHSVLMTDDMEDFERALGEHVADGHTPAHEHVLSPLERDDGKRR